MEHFQPSTRNNKVYLLYLQCKLQQDRRSLIQLQVKMPQKSRNKLFQRKKTINKEPSKIFRGFKVGKNVRVVFPKPKVNGTFSAVKNKQYGVLRLITV